MRDSFIFYKSFYALIKLLKPKDRSAMYEAIFDYGFYGKITEFDENSPQKAIFDGILPQLMANQRRYENGLKGGAKVGNQNAVKKQPNVDFENNQNSTEKQPNENENVNVNVNENVIVSKKVSKKEKVKSYNEIFNEYLGDGFLSQPVVDKLLEFIKHLQLKGVVLLNSRLESIIVELDLRFKNDVDKIFCIDKSISLGYTALDFEL